VTIRQNCVYPPGHRCRDGDRCQFPLRCGPAVAPVVVATPPDSRGASRTLTLTVADQRRNAQLLARDRAALQARLDEYDRLIALNEALSAPPPMLYSHWSGGRLTGHWSSGVAEDVALRVPVDLRLGRVVGAGAELDPRYSLTVPDEFRRVVEDQHARWRRMHAYYVADR
jgi:hypothetical protein